MVGAQGHPGGQQPQALCGVADLVAAEVEPLGDPPGPDGVGGPQPGHAGGGHQIFVGKDGQNPVDQHGLGLGLVEGLTDDVRVFQQGGEILFRDPGGVETQRQIRGDLPQVFRQGVGFWLPQLVGLVLLPVEVGEIDLVKVDEDQLAHPRPGQGDGDVGAQPPQAADGHRGLGEFLLEGLPVAGFQGGLPLGFGGKTFHVSPLPRS